jgi:hypothetical protein
MARISEGQRSRVRVTLSSRSMKKLGDDVTTDMARRAAQRTKVRIQGYIRQQGRVRTGAMVRSIRTSPRRSGPNRSAYSVTSGLPYTKFQNDGIGPVVARPGSVLRFKPKGSNVFIFRPRTRGFTGGHFFEKAQNAIRLTDFLE